MGSFFTCARCAVLRRTGGGWCTTKARRHEGGVCHGGGFVWKFGTLGGGGRRAWVRFARRWAWQVWAGCGGLGREGGVVVRWEFELAKGCILVRFDAIGALARWRRGSGGGRRHGMGRGRWAGPLTASIGWRREAGRARLRPRSVRADYTPKILEALREIRGFCMANCTCDERGSGTAAQGWPLSAGGPLREEHLSHRRAR